MTPQDVEHYLKQGMRLRFAKEPQEPGSAPPIFLFKRQPNWGYLALLEAGEQLPFVQEQEQLARAPYHVCVSQCKGDARLGDGDTHREEHAASKLHRFATLDEVERFVHGLGYSLSDLQRL